MLILDTGVGSAEENMSFDEKLLSEMDPKGEPILHFYKWARPSATYGYFIAPEKHLDLGEIKKWELDLARRPTGGGIVFHIWDFAFSFLMPAEHPFCSLNTLDNYQFVNELVLDVMRNFLFLEKGIELIASDSLEKSSDCRNFCMAKPTRYDVVYQDRKIAGAAQRRRRQGYLHQGTISLAPPQWDLLSQVLLSKNEVVEAMMTHSFAPLKSSEMNLLNPMRLEIQQLLQAQFMGKLQ